VRRATIPDLYNRQLHPSEKTLAQKMADDAKARGITNPDGSPITVDQIENAMRSADNSQYGETITTGMAVPLSGSTKSSQLYDTTGMLVTNDGAGNNYLVQNPSMFVAFGHAVQSDSAGQRRREFAVQLELVVAAPQAAQAGGGAPKIDPNGPFSPGWNTGDYSAGLPSSDPRDNPTLVVQGGFHLPISPGVAIGPNASWSSGDGTFSIKPDVAVGEIGDAGVAIGLTGDSRYSGPSVVNIGMGKYLGIQVTPSNVTGWDEKSWYDPARYVNGVSVGLGVGYSAQINVTTDPTYQSPAKR